MADFSRPTHHKHLRRAKWHNYALPGTYMLTVVVEGRRPVFGTLMQEPSPHIALSPLGEMVRDMEINKIHACYPNVAVWEYVIMPDHIHLIVPVDKPFEGKKHLGNVVYGFKTGCTRAWWQLTGMAPPPPMALGGNPPSTVAATVPEGFPSGAMAAKSGWLPVLFEKGYNDRILMREGQLERWKNYLKDNPRRLALKRRFPQFFTVLHNLQIAGRNCQITGNRFLLDIPDKMAIIVHSHDDDQTYLQNCRQWLACGERGGVLVSAAIAAREKAVMRQAMDRGYSVILLRENGFPTPYKPSGEAFDACSSGQLLQISPWQYHYDRRTITRAQCLSLNALAQEIAADTTSWY